ncbi:MAG: transcriptional repressor, partial [Bacteroidia bacterium]|nr:transcriptional repressor [Bacteroidia bacterium]
QTQGHRISRATVYNTLELLEECGLIRKHAFSEERTLYEKALIRAQHDHIVCIECGHIHEFCDPQVSLITESVSRMFAMKPQRHELVIYASCTQNPCPNRPLSLPLQRNELQP